MVNMTCQVTVLDLETVAVNWSVTNQGVEIVFGPVGVSYYIVQPVLNPLTTSAMLENLVPFTSYQLVVRTPISSANILKTNTVYFNTSASQTEADAYLRRSFKLQEFFLILFVLILWVVVVSIFFQRWGKIRSLLPYQPVYSKEMVEKIEKIETEKKIRSARTSFSFLHIDGDNGVKTGLVSPSEPTFPTCQTSSTICLPYSCSMDKTWAQRRKAKSAEHVSCPRIVIEKSLSSQISSSSQSLPTEGDRQPPHTLSIPRERKQEPGIKQRKSGNCSRAFIPRGISRKSRAISETFVWTLSRAEQSQ